jgi:sterol desaturase/sphingolipid hydroxylase (fatty acid hydroxylase superfamily)
MTSIASAVSGIIFAEFFGYWLHILLHNDKIKWLSRSHMQHHLREYHPSKPIRLNGIYLSSGATRANIAGIGMEWIIPIGLLLVAIHGSCHLIGVPMAYQIAFTGGALGWSWILFGYMHDAMHLKYFWMQDAPAFIRNWFIKIRRYHDVHHYTFNDQGVMPTNYGICFFFFDRVFGTLKEYQSKFNRAGLAASEKRFAYIHD